jgi:8-oxo-dGTP diphosphatase
VTCVVAAVAARRGHVLVCQRDARGRHPGKWEFPGGKMERGETPESALRRELREELSVDAVIGPEIWRTRYRYPDGGRFELRFFSVRSLAGRLRRAPEIAALRWHPAPRLEALDFLEADRDLVAALAAGRLTGVCETTRAIRRVDRGLGARASTSSRLRGARRGW